MGDLFLSRLKARVLAQLTGIGLTQRLVLYIAVVAAVPVALIAFFAFRTGSQGIRDHTEAHLTSVVIVKSQEVERWLRPLEATAQVLAESPVVRSGVATLVSDDSEVPQGEASAGLVNYLSAVVRGHIGLNEIVVLSADTQAVVAKTNIGPSFSHALVPLYPGADSGVRVYTPPYGYHDGIAQAAVSTDVVDNGKVLAHLVLFVSTLPLYESLSPDAGLGPTGKVYLVNQAGEVLILPQRMLSDPQAIRISRLFDVTQQPATGVEYPDFFGQRVFGVYQPVKSLGWSVVAELPTSVAFRDIEQMRWVVIGASASFLVLLFAVAFLVTQRVARPLRILAEGAGRIGSGDLTYRIHIPSNDELGLLARSFNQMAEDLGSAQARMVEAERAAALQAFTEEKVEQLKHLSRVGILIATESSLGGLVEKVPSLARDITRADIGILVVFTEEGDRTEYLGHTAPENSDLITRLLEDRDFLDLMMYGRSIHHSAPGSRDCAAQPCTPGLHEFEALLSVPLQNEAASVAGAIMIASVTGGRGFSQEDQELLQVVAGYVSAALQKIRKEHRLQVSERKALEAVQELRSAQEQLVQAQKMESIGRLAGGVAHDFNNLLTPIMAYAQLASRAVPPGEGRLRSHMLEIQHAAERAANLTRQLLAFSRREIIEPRVINLNDLILDMEKMLRRLIGEDIELATMTESSLGSVKVDVGQMEQVIMNMVVNARDAMPYGGKLTIQTANVAIDSEFARRHPNLTPGDYILLSMSDTGVGMTEEVKAHIFEPFFTTKEEGKGTGLGLATCYGIIERNRGYIDVESEVGKGTTFKVYLPRVRGEESKPVSTREEDGTMPRGTETVLLAEDEDSVRSLAARVLQQQGYTVLQASNGVEALDIAQRYQGEVHLLVTDVVMPVMGGRDLADRLASLRPTIKVLFITGYTDDAIIRHGALASGVAFAQKPFSATSLACKVREVLDQKTAAT